MAEVKKFNETKIGAFLASKAPKVLSALGDVLPNQGTLGVVKNLITSDNKIKAVDKEQAMKLIEQDLQELKEVSNRWRADMKSDSWLSKNVRPLILVWCIVIFSMAGILDSIETLPFHINELWNDTFEKVMMAVVLAYFGGRTTEKASNIFKQK